MFALPLAIYLLHNFIAQIPRDLIEAGLVDGVTLPGVPYDHPAAGDPGAGRVRDLPVPVGLERPAGGPHLRRGDAAGRR